MKIIIDAMGGDNAPKAMVQGALDAAKEYGVEVVLVGRGEAILTALHESGVAELPAGVEICHADQVIEMSDNPANAVKEKKDSSMIVGLGMLRRGEGDAFVSAGSTGALLAGSTMLAKRIRGIRRAALTLAIPTEAGRAVLVDCGANAECTPEFLLQFAFMGSYYAERVLGKPEPRVGLLNIGVEASKGTDLQREAYVLLQKAADEGRINFAGNIEGREAMEGAVDVIVCDGYSGNVFLKTIEGTGIFLGHEIKKMFLKSFKTKLAALLMKDQLKEFKKLMDVSEVGGTALMGISKPVVKAHGSSDARAFKNAIRQAVEYKKAGIIEDITENVEYMRLPVHSLNEQASDGE